MLLCVQAVTTKGHLKCIIIEKTAFRLYAVLHVRKSELRILQIII